MLRRPILTTTLAVAGVKQDEVGGAVSLDQGIGEHCGFPTEAVHSAQ